MSSNFARVNIAVNDLTGRITKTEQIANGQCGEVWKGTYTVGDRENLVRLGDGFQFMIYLTNTRCRWP